MKNTRLSRIISLLMVLALLLTSAALADSFSAIGKAGGIRIYFDAGLTNYWGTMPANSVVTVLAYNENVAQVSYRGYTAFAPVSDMNAVSSVAKRAIVYTDSRVFQYADLNSYSVAIPAGQEVSVLATQGSCAMVERSGRVGYMYTGHLIIDGDTSAVETAAESKTETAAGAATEATEASAGKRAVVYTDSRVFQYADLNSYSVAIPAGLEVSVLATQGSCAAVQRNGYVGYMYVGHLIIDGDTSAADAAAAAEAEAKAAEEAKAAAEAAEAAAAAEAEASRKNPGASADMEAAFESGNYSNEELIYAFAVKVMGYNSAAAIGLLANIKAESGFRPNASGDSGSSIGICQWHAGRKTRLESWCASNGFDAATLLGQLYYLKYELENYYPKVHNYLKSVSNDASGCYDAAYYFCYHFEAPSNRASKSDTRGNTAKTTFYPKYASV